MKTLEPESSIFFKESNTKSDPIINKLRKLTEDKSRVKIHKTLQPKSPSKEMILLKKIHMASKLEDWTQNSKTKFKLYNKALEINHNIQIREQMATTISMLNNRNVLIIHGGTGCSTFKDLHIIDLERFYHNKLQYIMPKNYKFERYGHTIHLVNGILYDIGGFNGSHKYVTSAPNLFYYNFANLFYEIDMKQKIAIFKNFKRNEYPAERKNHTSTLIDNKYILLIGGIDLNDNLLDDMWIYSIRYNIWCELNINKSQKKFT